MKKLLSVFVGFFCFTHSFASHLMGGDVIVNYNQDAGGYLVKLTYIRDVNGANVTPIINYSVYNTISNAWSLYQYNKAYFDSTLSAINSVSYPQNLQVKIYLDTISTAALPLGNYLFETNLCCRSGFILNLDNPATHGVELMTKLFVDSLHNSSPNFLLNQPIIIPLNQTITFTSYPYDIGGDLLSTQFSSPVEVSASPDAPLVIPGTQLFQTNPVPFGPIDLNAETGQISWKPNTIGTFIHSSTVTEFRNKKPIGSLLRDYQYIVVDMPDNHPPTIQGLSPFTSNGNLNYVFYTPGNPLTFQVKGNDIDNNYPLTIQCASTLFMDVTQPVFSFTANNSNAIGTFQWTPPVSFTKDVEVVFRVKDSVFSNDFVLMMKYESAGVNNYSLPACNLSCFPNPAQQMLSIQVSLTNDLQYGKINLFAFTGQKIKTFYEGKINKGTFILEDDLNIPSGIYFISVEAENRVLKTDELMVR